MSSLTPVEIVAELDKYIVGQDAAKRCIAIAMRNRWRRQQLSDDMRNEVLPKNIIMIGPTGVGKTEIARRMANLVNAPFIKVEASRYTEVGYHGRDVESMVRDLVKISVNMVMAEAMQKVSEKAQSMAEESLLAMLLPMPKEPSPNATPEEIAKENAQHERTREKLRKKLRDGSLDSREVEISTERGFGNQPMVEIFSNAGIEEMGVDLQDMLERLTPSKRKSRHTTVREARALLQQEAAEKLIDRDDVIREAISRAENQGIIFIDEIDKIAFRGKDAGGPDVSREGVQRDMLPIVEGTTVTSKFGMIKTDFILFIAAGAFHISKPSDLIPELQGRFPIRVELTDLSRDDFRRILTEPKNALTKQYQVMLETEEVKIKFTNDAIDEMAKISEELNSKAQNIGARRLHTVLEKVLEEVSFDAPQRKGETLSVNATYVREKLAAIVKDDDLSKYIL